MQRSEILLHYISAGGSLRAMRAACVVLNLSRYAVRLFLDNQRQKRQCISGFAVTAGQFLVYFVVILIRHTILFIVYVLFRKKIILYFYFINFRSRPCGAPILTTLLFNMYFRGFVLLSYFFLLRIQSSDRVSENVCIYSQPCHC